MSVKTVPGALDILNQKLGGTAGDIPASSTKEYALEKIYRTLGGEETLEGVNTTSEIIEKIADVAQGGGSSDFSTAEVTINTTIGAVQEYTRIETLYIAPIADRIDSMALNIAGNRTINAVLYKGAQDVVISTSQEITTSGDIEIIEQSGEVGSYEYYATITGDCTINCTVSNPL